LKDLENINPDYIEGSGDPPEPEELITALQELENAASSDAEVRSVVLLFSGFFSDKRVRSSNLTNLPCLEYSHSLTPNLII